MFDNDRILRLKEGKRVVGQGFRLKRLPQSLADSLLRNDGFGADSLLRNDGFGADSLLRNDGFGADSLLRNDGFGAVVARIAAKAGPKLVMTRN